tara:strand:- start:927 stop:1220 length:294 start_codon:yes stop_codon:yes gene_type:complete
LAGIIDKSALMQEITPLGVACARGALLASSRAISKAVVARRTLNGLPSTFESYRNRVHHMLKRFLRYEAFLGTGVGGNHLRIITSPIERIQFQGIAT